MKEWFRHLPQALVQSGKKHKGLKYPIVLLLIIMEAVCEVCNAAKALAHPQMRRRALAGVLSLCMVFTLLPMNAFAAEAQTQNAGVLCEHHPAHDADCGYVEAEPGHPCEHEHTADCYSDELICGLDEIVDETASDSDAEHIHTQECYALDCQHEHDDECGYIEAVEGQPCGYSCEICNVQDSGKEPEEEPKAEAVAAAVSASVDDENKDGYHDGDVAAINAMIANNNLSATKDDPASWGTTNLVIWDQSTPKRITSLTVNSGGLIGTLDVSALTSLTGLRCSSNQLTALNVSGLTSLDELYCSTNQLTALDVSGLTSLATLNCSNNQLTALDLSGLTSLTTLECSFNQLAALDGFSSLSELLLLYCSSNQLTALDVSGLTNLLVLECAANPIASFKLPDGNELTVGSATGGEVELTAYDHSYKAVTLTATAASGYTFDKWTATGVDLADDTVSPTTFVLSANITITPSYTGGTADPNDTNKDGYHDGDVAVINAMIANNNLSATKDDPASWSDFIVWDDTSTPQRITFFMPMDRGLTGTLDVSDLTSLTSLFCIQNQLTALDLSGLTNLISLYCYENQLTALDLSGLTSLTDLSCHANPITSLKLPDGKELTVGSATGGKVELTAYDHNAATVTLEATADTEGGYAFEKWTASGTTLTDDTANPITFTLDGTITFTPSYTGGSVDAEKIAAAKSAIEGGTYTVAQADANTEAAVKTALASQISTLSGMSATGITVTADNITVSSFTAATAGTADDTDGTNGSFTFTVALSKGAASETTSSKSGTITATAYTGQTNAQAVAAAKSAIEGGTYTLAQTDANTEAAVKTALVSKINTLSGMSATGITVTADNITISSFTAATAGDVGNTTGTNGSFAFTVALSKGTATGTTDSKTGAITATVYIGQTDAEKVVAAKSMAQTALNQFIAANATTDAEVLAAVKAAVASTGVTAAWKSGDGFNKQDATTSAAGSITGTILLTLNSTKSEVAVNLPIAKLVTDKTTLTNAIAAAGVAKNSVSVSDSAASSVANGTKFVTTAEMKALTDAIVAAQVVADDSSSTAEQVSAAVTALNNAVAAFNAVIKTGTYTSGGGGGSSSDSGSSGSGSTTTTPGTDSPKTGQTTITVPVDANGNATITVTDKAVADAIKAAQDAAKKDGLQGKQISVEIVATTDKAATQVTATLPKTVQETLISNQVDSVKISTNTVTMTFSQAAIQQMNGQAKADVTITAAKSDISKLTGDAKALIGSRPMFDFNATYGNGSKITDFGGNTVSIAIPYTLGKGEVPGNLFAIYVDGNGKAAKITNSSYNADQKAVIFTTSHFSQYAVGYQASYNFTDITGHWAKTDIEFVANRSLMSGTSNTAFSPNGSMTRGMFVTALGRLAGVDSTRYKDTRFTDVAADAYYAPYTAWALEKGITSGTSNTTFSPDKTITRQEMAVFMCNYAKAMGCKVPETRAAVTFTDNASIGSFAAAAVKQMQMAGVVSGKDGNLFDPAGTATRAEAAAVLHRYVELVIDPATAQGWAQNDSGHWLYYQGGKALTGWREIDGKWYYFDENGVMAVNTRIDGYEVGPDGARKES